MFSKDKPKCDLNLFIVQPLKEIARLVDILKLNNNDMETKEMKIVPPEGYEIDKENSTFECVKFKPIKKDLTYEDVAIKLFCNNHCFHINQRGVITYCEKVFDYVSQMPNNCTSEKQAGKLLAINKLMNVAKYLNGEDWKPDWDNEDELKYFINKNRAGIYVSRNNCNNFSIVYFKSKEDAQQAIEILGEETIRLALSTDW